jgi:TetR/AcrR family transcriptional regulator, copper-responsive repressor
MVQKEKPRRGRPRAYDPDTALTQATALFWDQGYAGTSLDDLSQATGMNRPSLYGAFGDKKALYLAALARYRDEGSAMIERALGGTAPLREALERFYLAAITLYLLGEYSARGCFLIGTATTPAVLDPEMRAVLGGALGEYDRLIEARLRLAQEQGELPADIDPRTLSKLVSAILHSLAVRARAGDAREELEATARAALALICGPAGGQDVAPTAGR